MTSLHMQPLPYLPDSATLIKLIAALPGAVCLDSGVTRRTEARYDILSALPCVELQQCRQAQSDQFDISQRSTDKPHWEPIPAPDIYSAAAELHQLYQPSKQLRLQLEGLPFAGGLIGTLAYPCGQDTRAGYRADYQTDDATILQQQPDAWFGLYQWAVIVDHETQQTTLFILPACPLATRTTVLRLLTGRAPASEPAIPFELTGPFQPLTSKPDYAASFERLKNWIVSGDCYQANLAIGFRAQYRGDPLPAYLRLREISHSPFSAFVRTDSGAILSMSPERFLSVDRQLVTTQPIKGTRRRSSDPAEDQAIASALTHSPKDRAENLMIVDLLRNDLGKVCSTGSIRTPELFRLHSFSHVHHLVSTVTGRLPDDVNPLTLMAHCFPGGSITGAPKIRAMQIIGQLEPVPRNIYCGTIMYCDFNNRMDSNICIRTLLCTDQQIFCWGGGGVVADSRCEAEYQECHDKVAALMQHLETSSETPGLQ